MKRKALAELIKWKEKSNKKPLIIRGARQVGKTWLMKYFGKTHYKQTAYINFDGNKRMADLFEQDYDISRILEGLSIESGIKINPSDTLIIFDEVQECKKALTSLKYFYEKEPQYNIIAAGSLLGVALHQGTSFPVGKVEFMDLYPLTFSEFMEAMGHSDLLTLLEKQDFALIKTFQDKYIDTLKQYYYVGGMPEVVLSFSKNKDYQEVRKIQNDILTAYEQDFSKYISPQMVTKLRMLWNSIPAQLSKENKKFIYGVIKEGSRAKEYETALTWLMDCGLVYKINRVKKPGHPLSAYEDISAFKLFIVDVGLLSALTKLDVKTLLEGSQVFEEFKGALTEQYVLQQLKTFKDMDIFYWANDAKAELDFLLQIDNMILPVEAKATTNLKAKSLKSYCDANKCPIAIRYSTASYKKTDNLYDIPLYLLEQSLSIIKDN